MTDTTASAPAMSWLRRLFGTVHLWVGVLIGIPAAVLGFSGIWLILIHPLPSKIGADSYQSVASIDAVVAAARAAAPDGAVPQQFDSGPAGKPVAVRFAVPRSEENPRGIARVQIDPATLAPVRGEAASPRTGSRFIHDLHEDFLIGRDGRIVVGLIGLTMCGMCFSGVVIWWPKRGQWRKAFTISGKGSTVMVLREIHGAAGIWGLVVFFIISLTGTLVAFFPGGGAGDDHDHDAHEHHAAAPPELHADVAAALVGTKLPGYVLRSVALPEDQNDGYKLTLVKVGNDRTVPPVIITTDASGSQVAAMRDTAEDAMAWAKPVHAGGTMGWVWWVLTLLSGTLPIIFAFSGISMWLIKRRNKARMAALA